MRISKVWQWIRDKKTNTLRKWRSTFIGGGIASTFEGDQRDFASELDLPESNLKPIGGSCNALSIRPQSDQLPRKKLSYKKRRASEKLNGDTLTTKSDDWDNYDELDFELNPDETYQNYEEFFNASLGDSDDSHLIQQPSQQKEQQLNQKNQQKNNRFKHQRHSYHQLSSYEKLTNEKHDFDIFDDETDEEPIRRTESEHVEQKHRITQPVSALRRVSETVPSNINSDLNVKQKKLRFNIPQVSLSSAEEPTSSTLLLSVDQIREASEEEERQQELYEQELENQCFLAAPKRDYSSSSEDEKTTMSEGSCTALTIGMAAAAVSAGASGSLSGLSTSSTSSIPSGSSSAPITPQPLQHQKTVDFTNVEDKKDENPPRRSVTDVERRRQSLAQRRQSNVQLVQSVSGRRNSTTLVPLTMAQIHLVRSLWRQIYVSKGPTVIGQTITHRLFFKLPKLKDQFRRCPLPKNFPNHDSFSKAHCKAMAELVDMVVDNLDNLEAISKELENIGRIHARIMRGELSSKIWNTVAETFIDCTLEWGDKRCRSETVRKAWALIVAFIVEKIKSGHLEERKYMFSLKASLQKNEITNIMPIT